MNRSDLVQAVQANRKAGLDSRAAADRAVRAVLAGIAKGLKKDKVVSLAGFGTFRVRSRKARMGRNPRTGERIKIKASRSVGFKAGAALKKSL